MKRHNATYSGRKYGGCNDERCRTHRPHDSCDCHSGEYDGYGPGAHDGYERQRRHDDSFAQGSFFSGPFYRARGGKIMGVCLGLARRFEVKVWFVRLAFIGGAFVSGFVPVILFYIALGILMKPEPVVHPYSTDERDFYSSYVSSRKDAATRLKEKFNNVEKRIRRMEDVVTSKEYDWERRFSQRR